MDRVLGEVIVNPDGSTSTVALSAGDWRNRNVLDAKDAERKRLPAITRDGFRVEVTTSARLARWNLRSRPVPTALVCSASSICFMGSRQTALRG